MLKVSRIVLSLFVVSGIALANPTKNMNSLDISKNDKEFLFGTNNANIVALNDVEMKDTDGKVIGHVLRLGARIGSRVLSSYQFANAPTIGGKTYNRNIKTSKRRR